MSVLKTFEFDRKHHNYSPVTISTGAVVAVGNVPVHTPREEALGWIILRLNAQSLALRENLEKARVEIEELKKLQKTS